MICLGRGGRKRCCWWYGGGLSSSGRWAFALLGLSPLKMDSGGKWFLRLLFVHAAAASMASHALSFFFPIASILFLATTTSTTITTKRNWRLSDVKSKDVDNVIFFYASEQTSMPRCALASSLSSSSS